MVKRRHVDVIGDRFRDLEVQVERRHASPGKNVVAVIGIDRYARWQPLSNAVRDAQGALAAFEHLGFKPLCPPLLDAAATADAIRSLVSDGLAQLTTNDSLVLFFAGHGYTNVQTFEDGDSVKTGYIIPVDGDLPGQSMARWLRLDTWLSDVARLAARHILVLLDACYSGIAVGSLRRYRGASPVSESFDRLTRRRSRKVITSAQDDQRALDSGPRRGHSLFTGCLLDGLTGGLGRSGDLITGSQIGLYLQSTVTAWPDAAQTPDFGVLEEDRSGELVIRLRSALPEIGDAAGPDVVAWPADAKARTTGTKRVPRPQPVPSLPPSEPAPDAQNRTTITPAAQSRDPVINLDGNALGRPRAALLVVLSIAGITSIAILVFGLRRLHDTTPERTSVEFRDLLPKDNPWRKLADGPSISSKQITVGEYAMYLGWVAGKPGGTSTIGRPAEMPRDTAHLTDAEHARPLGGVTFAQAERFCADAGGRLLTTAEWHLLGFVHGDIENSDGTLGPLREWTRAENGDAKVCGTDRRPDPDITKRYQIECADDTTALDVGFRCALAL